MDQTYVNLKYKNNLFCDLFSEKEHALSLYNALNHSAYTNIEDLEIATLSDAIFMQQKNDVSIMFQNELHLWEHQSTLNNNMPLRGLVYYAHNVDGLLKARGITLYGKKMVKIPSPAYYVFYNGTDQAPERWELKLSDSFAYPAEGYEWTAHMVNVNADFNQDLMDHCPVLKGYAMLIHYIRENQADGLELKNAVEQAIDRCIHENDLKPYLLKKKAEVKLMLLTEFDQEAYERVIREEEREEGRVEGRIEGRQEGRQEGRVEGRQEGREEEKCRINQLNSILIAQNRMDDLKRSISDPEYQEKLILELLPGQMQASQ